MARFVIKQVDPHHYKEDIYRFWEQYLDITVQNRLNWMAYGNPAGPSQWFFAFTEKSDEVAGMVSIIPREFYFEKKKYRGGMLGDFMVETKYRVFGPAIPILRYVQEKTTDLGFDFLYSIPKAELTSFVEGLGYKKLCTLKHLIRPVNASMYTRRFIGPHLSRLFSPLINMFLFLSTFRGNFRPIIRDEEADFITDFAIEEDNHQLSGDRTLSYLTWRYPENPTFRFSIRQFYRKNREDAIGFVVYTLVNNKIDIYDIYTSETKLIDIILQKFLRWAHHQKADAVYFRISTSSRLYRKLKYHLFFDTKDDAFVMYFTKNTEDINLCYFNWGDKII